MGKRGELSGVDCLTRVGKCPICKATIERTWGDIFFPFCGYTHYRAEANRKKDKKKKRFEKEQNLDFDAMKEAERKLLERIESLEQKDLLIQDAINAAPIGSEARKKAQRKAKWCKETTQHTWVRLERVRTAMVEAGFVERTEAMK